MTRDMTGSKCILDVEQEDKAMFGFVEKVLDTSNIQSLNGSHVDVDGPREVKTNGKVSFSNGTNSHRENNEHQSSFGKPLLASTFITDKVTLFLTSF